MNKLYTTFNTDSFLSPVEISAIKHQNEVANSQAKRGLKPVYHAGLSTTSRLQDAK